MLPDEFGKPRTYQIQDVHEDDVFEEGPHDFVCVQCPVIVPLNDFIPPSCVIEDDRMILVIKSCRCLCFRIVLEVNDVEEVYSFCLDIVFLS